MSKILLLVSCVSFASFCIYQGLHWHLAGVDGIGLVGSLSHLDMVDYVNHLYVVLL